MSMHRHSVYLDHNATTAIRPEAVVAMSEACGLLGNPSSVHRFGRLARRIVEDAREAVAALVGAEPTEVVFTSGGSEANALALRGAGRARILVSAVEHASVLESAPGAGVSVETVPVDAEGMLDLAALEAALAGDDTPALVSLMAANNETGVVQPVAEAAAIARRFGAFVHCDAVQAAGRIAIDRRALGADLLTLSAHKLGGPMGVGALIVDARLRLEAAQRGGGQERGRRSGTENLPGIAGFGTAAQWAAECSESARLGRLRDDLEAELRRRDPDVCVFGAGAPRLPNTSCLSRPGQAAEVAVIAFDLEGVAVSAGAACSSGKVGASHVLQAMGVGEELARAALRVSLGWSSMPADIERFIDVWTAIKAQSYRRRSAQDAGAVRMAGHMRMSER